MWTTTKRCLLRCIATLCVATVFFVRAEDTDASIGTQLAKLIADDGAANDEFGCSVAVSDGIAVVGARKDVKKGSWSGSAYVFEMSDSSDATSWTQVAKLTADDGAKDDYFGRFVAVSDGTIVVGALLDDDKGSNSGSAYVFDVTPEPSIKLLKTIYANGTITEEVVKSSAAARLGAALMPSSSSDAFVAAVACVALLAVVATRRARKTSFVNGEEADGLLNANTYGAIYNA